MCLVVGQPGSKYITEINNVIPCVTMSSDSFHRRTCTKDDFRFTLLLPPSREIENVRYPRFLHNCCYQTSCARNHDPRYRINSSLILCTIFLEKQKFVFHKPCRSKFKQVRSIGPHYRTLTQITSAVVLKHPCKSELLYGSYFFV